MHNNNLIVLLDWVNSGFSPKFLDIASLIAILFATCVITIKNPISSLMSLIGLFGFIAVYLLMIGLNYIGFSYLIVYIGAVSILFLFILMLIDVRKSELLSNNINSVPLALLVIVLLNYTWLEASPSDSPDNSIISFNTLNDISNTWTNFFSNINYDTIMFSTSNTWDGSMSETSHITGIGMVMYSTFNMWLLMSGLILLLAMVGCIVITLSKTGD